MSPDYKISTLDFRKHKWDTYQKMSVAKKKKTPKYEINLLIWHIIMGGPR